MGESSLKKEVVRVLLTLVILAVVLPLTLVLGGVRAGDSSHVVSGPADAYATRAPNDRHLARAVDGRLWCCYVRNDGSNDVVYASYSDDDGVNWTEEAVSTGEGDHVSTAIAIDSENRVHCVYQGKGYGDYPANYQIVYRGRTESWQAEELITNVEADQQYVAIAIDSSDHVHAAWSGMGWDTFPAQSNVKYRKRTVGWQAYESVTDVDAAQKLVSIAVDSSGYVYLVWNGKGWGVETAQYNIQYRQRTDSWQAQEALTDVSDVQEAACIALDSSEIPHVAWYGAGYGVNSTKTQVAYSNRIGGSWVATAHLTDKTDHQGDPSISIDASDRRYVVWQGKAWGVNVTLRQICLVRYESDAWQTVEPLTDRSEDQRYASAIWASYPASASLQLDIPLDGCAFVFTGKDAGGTWVEYMYTDDLDWSNVPDVPEPPGPHWLLRTFPTIIALLGAVGVFMMLRTVNFATIVSALLIAVVCIIVFQVAVSLTGL